MRFLATSLTAHPDGRSRPAVRIRAEIARAAGALSLVFVLAGDLAEVRVPEPTPAAPVFTDDLWRRTCFELFVAHGTGDAYLELNLAPSRAWAAYAFAGYRSRIETKDAWPVPTIDVARDTRELTLRASVTLGGPWAAYAVGPIHVGATAVVEDARGALSYWAARHAPVRPDFHRPDVRTLVIS